MIAAGSSFSIGYVQLDHLYISRSALLGWSIFQSGLWLEGKYGQLVDLGAHILPFNKLGSGRSGSLLISFFYLKLLVCPVCQDTYKYKA